MDKNSIDRHASNDQGQDDAGDASASLYRNEETMDNGAEKKIASLRPGENIDDLQAAKHGNPDKDIDLQNEDLEQQNEPIK